ncbi:MAG: division/cell wall cluster transcriptional repressor MraZ [bacterium]
MFKGSYQHSIDDKGRLSLPARFREQIIERSGGREEITLTSVMDCIEVYPLREWERIEEKLLNAPTMDKDIQMFKRIFFSRAHDCSLDKQGRVLLPAGMREKCNIVNKQVLIVGVMNKIEIWALDKWKDIEEGLGSKFDEIRDKLVSFGI